jgi:hemoglobin-like flavoprotein
MSLNVEISPQDVARVRDDFDRIWPVSDRMVELFYEQLFETRPELRPLFRHDMNEQKRKFISTLAAIIAHLDDNQARFSITGTLGRHHVDYGVAPEHYAFVKNALLTTLASTLGVHWTADAADSWGRAYDVVSAEMLQAASA